MRVNFVIYQTLIKKINLCLMLNTRFWGFRCAWLKLQQQQMKNQRIFNLLQLFREFVQLWTLLLTQFTPESQLKGCKIIYHPAALKRLDNFISAAVEKPIGIIKCVKTENSGKPLISSLFLGENAAINPWKQLQAIVHATQYNPKRKNNRVFTAAFFHHALRALGWKMAIQKSRCIGKQFWCGFAGHQAFVW